MNPAPSEQPEALHGGRVWAMARHLGLDPSDILDFSANLNPLGPPAGVLAAFQQVQAHTLAAYPDTDAPQLRALLCARHHAPDPCLVLGHGGAALLMLALRALAPKRVLVPIPCFTEQSRALAAVGAEWVPCVMPNLRLSLASIEARQGDALLLTQPHNPTGDLLDRETLLTWLEAHPHLALVVDEAFMDYAPNASLLPTILSRPRAVVLRSLTKFYAMPAVRVGYAFAHEDTARRMVTLQEGWPVGQVDLLAAQAALADVDYEERTLADFQRDRAEFALELADRGLHSPASHGPFKLVHLGEQIGTALSRTLASQGILIRTCAHWVGLGDAYIRLALRSQKDRSRLWEVWKKAT